MVVGLIFLLILTAVADEETSKKVCGYHDVLNHLNLKKDNELYTMTRPVKDYRQPTNVSLDMVLYAILDVRETDQTFIPYVWMIMSWENEHISWNPSDFCDIKSITVPEEILWQPDLTIEEMTEKDRAPPSPYLTIYHDGRVRVQNDQVLVSTCRMHVYKFPFDTQSCSLTFKSAIHSVDELQLINNASSAEATENSLDIMRIQYEWLFVKMRVTAESVDSFGIKQDVVVYKIYMKRRSILYIVNFLLPVLFFLGLDLASFMISDSGGEKLSFKVTVLLAVTVLQLILNDILPASSNRIPLIAVYCIGVFGLMMLSLLETIVVMYLMGKDNPPEGAEMDNEQGRDLQDKEDHINDERKWRCVCVCDESADETPAKLLKASSSQLTDDSRVIEKLSDDLREVVNALSQILNSKKDDGKPGYWTKVAKTINKVFFVFYISAATMFLISMFSYWQFAH